MSEAITIEKMITYAGISDLEALASDLGDQGRARQDQGGIPTYRMSRRPGRNAMLRMMGIVAAKN
jgi:hypothetical protein